MVSTCDTKDGKRSSATTPTEEVKMGDAAGVRGLGDAQLELKTIINGYRAWAEEHRKKEEQWRRLIEEKSAKVVRHVDEDQQRSQQSRAGLEAIIAESGRQQPVREREAQDAMLQWKQRTLGEWDEPEDLLDMQARTWAGSCGICRIRRGTRMMHDWRECTKDEQDRSAVQQAHRRIAAVCPGSGSVARQLSLQMEGLCPGCGEARWKCWMQVKSDDPFADASVVVCRFRAVITESAAAIKGTESAMVKDWEERQGTDRIFGIAPHMVEDWEDREDWDSVKEWYGSYAVFRMWKTFAWLGILHIEDVGVKKFKGKYTERFEEFTRGELKGGPSDIAADKITWNAAAKCGVPK